MTIKEIETITGMSRANIRYYEAEGLVLPERKENGYCVYSENDAAALLKIKLLRSMDISLEEIKRVQAGQVSLGSALERQLQALTQRKTDLEQTLEVAQQILFREETFDSLDALHYLRVLETGGQELKGDVIPRLNLPWRRYWARCFDLTLYNVIISLLLQRFVLREGLTVLFTLVTMLLVEPLLLRMFATTPGKAIFGIRVTDTEENKLRYGDGLERTWTVLWEGEALHIPLISWYFQYKGLVTAENGEPLPWEWDSELTYKDDKMWRYGVYAAAYIGLMVFYALVVLAGG